MAVNPATGRVYVSNGDSHNEVRFEGGRPPCTPLTVGGPTPNSVVAHLSEADITVLDPSAGSVTPHHLNPHIDYCTVPSPAGTSAASLATPTGMAVTADGQTLYVAAFGSSDPTRPGTGKVGVFSTAALESDTFTPSAASHIVLSGGGASGLVLNEAHHRLYVLTRFDDALSVVDLTSSPGTEVQHLPIFNPEPPSVVAGRPFLYDAGRTSTNGEAACASCHIFGDFDSLAWDLGDPDGSVLTNPNPFRNPPGAVIDPDFHSLKGPMTTQTLRGMANNGPMHWRGDRTAGLNPGGTPLDAHGAFERFNLAFVGLTGMPGHCSVTLSQACDDLTPCPGAELCVGLQGADMDAFTDFILQVMLPPNPIRALDSSLTSDQQAGTELLLLRRRRRADLQRLSRARSGERTFRDRRPVELRERDPGPEDPASAQRVPEGGHVRHARGRRVQHRQQRHAGSVQQPVGPGARLRLPARRQRRHALPLPQCRRVQRRLRHREPRRTR